MTIPTDGRIDLDALAELAKKATPGPWRVASDLPAYAIMAMTPEGKGGHRVVQTPNQNNYRRFGPSNEWDGISQIANAAFIAALDPQTVLALIDLARRAAIPSEQGKAVAADFMALAAHLAKTNAGRPTIERESDGVVFVSRDVAIEAMQSLLARDTHPAPAAGVTRWFFEGPLDGESGLALTRAVADDLARRGAKIFALVPLDQGEPK